MALAIGTKIGPYSITALIGTGGMADQRRRSNSFLYFPSADGQRFLFNGYVTEAQPSLEVLLNWGRTPAAR